MKFTPLPLFLYSYMHILFSQLLLFLSLSLFPLFPVFTASTVFSFPLLIVPTVFLYFLCYHSFCCSPFLSSPLLYTLHISTIPTIPTLPAVSLISTMYLPLVELECIPYSVLSLLMYALLCNHPIISYAHACCKKAQSS